MIKRKPTAKQAEAIMNEVRTEKELTALPHAHPPSYLIHQPIFGRTVYVLFYFNFLQTMIRRVFSVK